MKIFGLIILIIALKLIMGDVWSAFETTLLHVFDTASTAMDMSSRYTAGVGFYPTIE
jgi:hypothetical protein